MAHVFEKSQHEVCKEISVLIHIAEICLYRLDNPLGNRVNDIEYKMFKLLEAFYYTTEP